MYDLLINFEEKAVSYIIAELEVAIANINGSIYLERSKEPVHFVPSVQFVFNVNYRFMFLSFFR